MSEHGPTAGRETTRTSLVRRIRQLYLDRAVLPRLGNVEGVRRLWDSYADDWRQQEAYLDVELSEADAATWRERNVRLVGDEWGTPEDVDRVLDDFVFPYVDKDDVVAEIGVGGGRIASPIAPRVGELWGFDISKGMLRRSRQALSRLSAPTIRGFFFVTPETVDLLAEKAGFVVERRSGLDPTNFYYGGDYLALLRKDTARVG